MVTPYHDFNPVDYVNQEVITDEQAKEELAQLLNTWNDGLKESLDDPMVKKNISLLDKKDSDLLKGFKEGKVNLERANALSIRNAIMKLYHGLEKIELSPEN